MRYSWAKKSVTTELLALDAAACHLLDNAFVIDGLDTGNCRDEQVFRDLRDGGATAVNATCAISEDFGETLNSVTAWLRWFEHYSICT